ncbi:MAG: cytochrome c biogenesis protein CcsA [Chloroflexi bacterium]|nr:cytochrome c biogenesis protein CcsA [Chloroflexota bacterium]
MSRTHRLLSLRPPAWFAWGAVAVTLAIGLFGVPPDRTMGDVFRIIYIHVPIIWLGFLAFFVTMVASALYLRRADLRFDRVAAASAEIGLLFTGLTIVTGSIWGKATWGVWWTFDPRLTTTAILFVIYLGYVLLRASLVERVRRARLSAVLGIVGFADVPIVHFSVLWWSGLHQAPSVLRPGDPTIDDWFLWVLMANVFAFTLLYVWLLHRRVALEATRDAAERLLEGGA